jgi:hypothetical protein
MVWFSVGSLRIRSSDAGVVGGLSPTASLSTTIVRILRIATGDDVKINPRFIDQVANDQSSGLREGGRRITYTEL